MLIPLIITASSCLLILYGLDGIGLIQPMNINHYQMVADSFTEIFLAIEYSIETVLDQRLGAPRIEDFLAMMERMSYFF